MDLFDGLAVARRLWPRFIATLLLAALAFFPKTSISLIEQEAKHRAEEISTLLTKAVVPTTKQGEKRTAVQRDGFTDAPPGVRPSDRENRALP